MSENQQDMDIKDFKNKFFKEHNLQVYVFKPDETKYELSLDILVDSAYNAFVENHPEYNWIESLASRVRYREFQVYYQTASHLAWCSGHRKTNIGKAVKRNHASIINGIRMVENAFFTKDMVMINAYKQILKHIIKDVGTIPKNIKRKIDSQPNSHLVWDETKNCITSS